MLTIFVLISVGAACVEGLKCPSCTYLTTTADIASPFRTVIEGALALFQDDACSKPLTGPIPQIKEEACNPEGGKEARCLFFNGNLTLKVNLAVTEVEIPFTFYERRCYTALPENIPSDGCHDKKKKTDLQHIIETAVSVLAGIGKLNFNGKSCFCSDTYCQDTSGVNQGVHCST